MIYLALALHSLLECSALFSHPLVASTPADTLRKDLGSRLHGWESQWASSVSAKTCRCCWRDCEYDAEDRLMAAGAGEHKMQVRQSISMNTSGAGDVDAWLLMADTRHDLSRNVYTPILESVRYGLRNVAQDVRVIDTTSLETMLDGISAAAAKGKRPLVMAVSYWLSLPFLKSKLRDASERGAYLVLYQTESGSAEQQSMASISQTAGEVKAHEIWDSSLDNLDVYPSSLRIPTRYVPPGYAPSLDVGVDLNSPIREENKIGYIGLKYRAKPINWRYESILGQNLSTSNSIWSQFLLKKFLDSYPIQLNMHKLEKCCPRDPSEKVQMHMEVLRFAELLSNRACVISPPGSDKDNHRWASVVRFVEVEDTPAELEKLAKDVRTCQTQSFDRFKVEFDAEKILRDSGFLDAWSPILTPNSL